MSSSDRYGENTSGYRRLKGLASAGMMSAGLLVAGSGRAATLPLTYQVDVSSGSSTIGTWRVVSGAMDIVTSIASTTTTASGTGFCLQGGTLLTSSGTYMTMFSCGMGVAVGGAIFSSPTAVVDLDARTVTSEKNNVVSNLDAQVEYYFHESMVVRASYILTNPGLSGNAVMDVGVGGNLDYMGYPQDTSSGDAVIDATDTWYHANDRGTGPGDSVSQPGLVISTLGADEFVYHPFADSRFTNMYIVNIPAGSTVRVLVFAGQAATIADGAVIGNSFSSPQAMYDAGLLAGMSNADLLQVSNIDFDTDDNGTADVLEAGAGSGTGGGSSGGGGSLYGLLILLLPAWLLRLRARLRGSGQIIDL